MEDDEQQAFEDAVANHAQHMREAGLTTDEVINIAARNAVNFAILQQTLLDERAMHAAEIERRDELDEAMLTHFRALAPLVAKDAAEGAQEAYLELQGKLLDYGMAQHKRELALAGKKDAQADKAHAMQWLADHHDECKGDPERIARLCGLEYKGVSHAKQVSVEPSTVQGYIKEFRRVRKQREAVHQKKANTSP